MGLHFARIEWASLYRLNGQPRETAYRASQRRHPHNPTIGRKTGNCRPSWDSKPNCFVHKLAPLASIRYLPRYLDKLGIRRYPSAWHGEQHCSSFPELFAGDPTASRAVSFLRVCRLNEEYNAIYQVYLTARPIFCCASTNLKSSSISRHGCSPGRGKKRVPFLSAQRNGKRLGTGPQSIGARGSQHGLNPRGVFEQPR